jgi:hypothetical protein
MLNEDDIIRTNKKRQSRVSNPDRDKIDKAFKKKMSTSEVMAVLKRLAKK